MFIQRYSYSLTYIILCKIQIQPNIFLRLYPRCRTKNFIENANTTEQRRGRGDRNSLDFLPEVNRRRLYEKKGFDTILNLHLNFAGFRINRLDWL